MTQHFLPFRRRKFLSGMRALLAQFGNTRCFNELFSVKECTKYKYYESIRKDSFFFYRSKLSLQKWIEGIFYWCQDLSVLQTVQFLNVSKKTVIDMFSFFFVKFVRNILKKTLSAWWARDNGAN